MLRNMTTIYIRHANKILMLYRVGSRVIPTSWCGIGGHFEESELNHPKACILRELDEETGIKEDQLKHIELRYLTMRLKNNEVRQNYYFFADLVNFDLDISKCDEGTLEWIEIEALMALEMPYTAKACLKHYINIGQFTTDLYGGIATQEGVNFVKLEEF